MSLLRRFYPETQFGGFTRWDGTIAFYARVQALLQPGMIAVDFGCGRGASSEDALPFRRNLRILRGKVQRVIGIDVSPVGEQNPFVDEFRLLTGPRWPLENESVDFILSDQVLEHLPEPENFFSEAQRALKPGGMLALRTPNRLSYVALASRLIPNRSHARVLSRVKDVIGEEDVFPTLYRCNTLPAIRRAMIRYGFMHVVYGYEPEPAYLSFSPLSYWLGTVHQKLSPEWLKPVIFAFGQKV